MIYFNCKYQYQYLHKDDFEKQPVASVNNTHYEKNTQGLTRECTPFIKGFGCCGWFPPPLRQVLAHSEMRCLEPRKLGRKSPYQTEWANEQDMTTCTNPDQNWVIRWGWALSPVNHKRTGTLDLDCRYSNIKVQDECHVLELYFVNHVVGHNGICMLLNLGSRTVYLFATFYLTSPLAVHKTTTRRKRTALDFLIFIFEYASMPLYWY